MKVVILAGGLGTRLIEKTNIKPKPMVEVGGMPVIWHIMKLYSYYGYNDFVICLGYKGNVIVDYFNSFVIFTTFLNKFVFPRIIVVEYYYYLQISVCL